MTAKMEVITCEKEFKLSKVSSILNILGENKWDLQYQNGIEMELFICTKQDEPNIDHAGLFLEFKKLPIEARKICSKITLISNKSWNDHKKQFKVYPNIRSGLKDFITKDAFFDEANGYLVNDTLTIRVEVKLNNGSQEIQPPPVTMNKIKLFGKIFQAKHFTDVTIKIQSQTVQAHKVLLAESSPVFRKLLEDLEKIRMTSKFRNNVKQILPVPNLGNHTILELKDLQFGVLQDMLKFIYGQKFYMYRESAKSLFIAANTYKINGLIKFCKKYLFKNLDVGNAAETLKLASDFDDFELERECLKFIGVNIKQIVTYKTWDEFAVKFPEMFYKVFQHCTALKCNQLNQKYKISNFEKKPTTRNKEICNLSEYLQIFYEKSIFTDVELIIQKERVLKAHKGILASRSTVFNDMIFHETVEVVDGKRIFIEDFDFETIQKLLRCMYSGKYNLMQLNTICADSMAKNLTVQNVCKILDVADKNSCTELKEKAIAFMARNIFTVVYSGTFKEMIQLRPHLFNEILKDWVEEIF